MTDPVTRQSLLPQESTPRECAIEGADATVADLDVGVIVRARSVADAPPAVLPALAWERSVDVWDPAWPDDTKRAVIGAAPEVHRHKGTVYAVKTALSALGVDADIAEWWQASPRGAPYTFSVTAYARARLYDGPLLDARLIRVVYASVLHASPKSRAFDLSLGAKYEATLGLLPVAVARSRTAVALHARNERHLAAPLGLAPIAVVRSRTSLAFHARNRRALAAPLGLAGVTVARVRVSAAFHFASPGP